MLAVLLPESAAGLRVEQLTASAGDWTLVVATTAPSAACPLCRLVSTRIHSHYQRALLDLPLAAHPVRLQLHGRRFLCRTVQCPRWIFAERLPGLTRPYAQHTTRLADSLRQIGLALGGAAGAHLAAHLTLPTSPDPLLRCVRRTPDQPRLRAPRIRGRDDWALRKGQRYGTIFVDLETGPVVDLLPDRATATVAAWLEQHPGAEASSRARAEASAEAARLGAPQARQLADRFHGLQNLGDALEELRARLYAQLGPLVPPRGGPPPTLESAASGATPADRALAEAAAAPAAAPPDPGPGPDTRQGPPGARAAGPRPGRRAAALSAARRRRAGRGMRKCHGCTRSGGPNRPLPSTAA